MRRSISALGGTLIALTLAAAPAWADTPGQQSITRSVGVVQVEPIHANAPVRVASQGSDAPGDDRPAAGGQAARSSAGAVQVGSVTTDTPVRVLSDGDDPGAPSGTGGGSQDSDHTVGGAQVGSAGANAPVRALSDGDDAADSTTAEVELDSDVPAGSGAGVAAALGSPGPRAGLTARLAGLTGRAAAAGATGSGGSDPGSGDAVGLDEPDGGAGNPNGVQLAGGSPAPSAGGTLPAGLFQAGALAGDAGALPLTGLRAWLLMGAGVWLLASGVALLLLGSLMRASGLPREDEHGRFAR